MKAKLSKIRTDQDADPAILEPIVYCVWRGRGLVPIPDLIANASKIKFRWLPGMS